MQFLKCTYIDAITGVPVTDAPTANGPAMPDVSGLQFVFANESQYPTLTPLLYCTAPDAAASDVPGVLDVLGQSAFEAAQGAELEARQAQAINMATAHRWTVETGGITLNAAQIATGIADQNRITSVIANAQLAGVESVDFKAVSGWVTLTVTELQGIAAAIAQHVQQCFSAERAHHEAISAAADFAELRAVDIYSGWPTSNQP